MADEWIKIRVDLPDDPNVYILSDLLSLECPTIVGHLVMFWGWMDRHTPDGQGIKLTESVIDKKIGVSGFAAALRQVGWLAGGNMALELPKFERHGGSSAKARALEAEAKRLRRGAEKGGVAPSEKAVGQVSDKTRPECRTREEKRREEKNINQNLKPTASDPDRQNRSVIEKPSLLTKRKRKLTGKKLMAFELFWAAFDYKKDRASAADAWFDLELDDDLLDTILRSAKTAAMLRPQEIAAGKTPIYPQGWLTGRRWEDEVYVPPNSHLSIRQSGRDTLERLSDRSWAEQPVRAVGG